MRILVTVESPTDFEAWSKSQLAVPTAGTDESSQNGQKLFASNTCVQCHAIAGTEAKADVGPDLSHLARRKTIGSGLLANTTENVAAWIINPQKFKPDCHMPKMRLSKSDAHDIAVYLESLK